MPTPTKPRVETRVWREGPGDFRYEVTHPAGHQAAGAHFKTTGSAKKAALAVVFAEPDPPAAGPT